MASFKVCLVVLVLATVVNAMGGQEAMRNMAQRGGRMAMAEQGMNARSNQWNPSARDQNGEEGGAKYRSNLYNDDDVYGYEATYPGGEARYISYKTSDARARRGPQYFARSLYKSRDNNLQQ